MLLFAILMLTYALAGCTATAEPGLEFAEAHLQQDMDDLLFLVDWLLDSGYSHVIFDESYKTAWADFENIQVSDEVQPTIRRLLEEHNYLSISMSKDSNRIRFCYWSSFHEQDCGLVYSIDHSKLPDVEYMTQCEPLSVDGWYYYFSDVNKWRVGETTAY